MSSRASQKRKKLRDKASSGTFKDISSEKLGSRLSKDEVDNRNRNKNFVTNDVKITGEKIELSELDEDANIYSFHDCLQLKEVIEVTSQRRSDYLMATILYPHKLRTFYQSYWERKPLIIKRSTPQYWAKFVTVKKLRNMLDKNLMIVDRDIAFHHIKTNFSAQASDSGKEISSASIFSECCTKGTDVVLLDAVKHMDMLWHLCSALEHQFSCAVRARLILSTLSFTSSLPPSTSTIPPFAYEEIDTCTDSFFLQMEGSSCWSISSTSSPSSSSGIEGQDSSELGQTVVLEQGDCFYLPRGWTVRKTHLRLVERDREDVPSASLKEKNLYSLTLQLRTNRENSMADLLQLLLPQSIEAAAAAEIGKEGKELLKKALPRNYPTFMGVAATGEDDDDGEEEEEDAVDEEQDGKRKETKKRRLEHSGDANGRAKASISRTSPGGGLRQLREAFTNQLHACLTAVSACAMSSLDPCLDQWAAKRFTMERLPVPLTPEEETATGGGGRHPPTIYPYTRLRMVRPGVARLAIEDGKVVVYHCMDNQREDAMYASGDGDEVQGQGYSQNAFIPVEFELDDGPTIEALLNAYPHSVVRNIRRMIS